MGRWLCWQTHMKRAGALVSISSRLRYKRGGHERMLLSLTADDSSYCRAKSGGAVMLDLYLDGVSWAYLAVLDLFARKPVGWAMSFSPDNGSTMKALEMAWEAVW